jgi:tetratricopeptide (TPR) repeat protein
MADLWSAIVSSSAVIAELTTRNPNVLYELGLAHAIRKPAVLLAQTVEDIPFDLKHIRTILYDTTDPDCAEQLRGSLTNTLTAIKQQPPGDGEVLPPQILNIAETKRKVLSSLSNLVTEEEFDKEDSNYWRGYFLMDFEDYEQALTCFEKCRELDPENDDALYQMACCHARLRNTNEMLSLLARAIAIDAENRNETLQDEDFDDYRDNQEFRKLTYL